MSRQLFTVKQQLTLRQNPYVYIVTDTRLTFPKDFKELFYQAYKSGETPRRILESHGFDISIIGSHRVYGISQHIRAEFTKYGEFHEGYTARQPSGNTPPAKITQADEIRQLRHEADYLS